jgi:DNA mismatch repair protein MutS2
LIGQKAIKLLEFDKVLGLVSNFCVSERSKSEIADIVPTGSITEAQYLLDATEEMCLICNKYSLFPIEAFDCVTDILKKATAGSALRPGELLKIAKLIRSGKIAKRDILSTGDDVRILKEAVSPLFINAALEKIISDSVAGENELKDSASGTLRDLRRQITAADLKLKEKLNSYTRASNLSKYLQDSIVTVRNGRFVLPVKSECRHEIQGLIHDQSSSGSTVFIEPLPVVELNNSLKSLRLDEEREVERILRELSIMAATDAENLYKCQEICTMLDIIYAKSRFSSEFKCVKPAINDKGYINLLNSRHPLIDKDKVVPVDLTFGKNQKLLLITGPNTGGKTVCLKTAGLFCMMAACGLYLPASEGSEIAVFDGIFCDIGDSQSILNSLSTFSSHILNIVNITKNITQNSLVLLDELGGGTDPAEGAALAIGIIKFLFRSGVTGIITTHYSELKQYALSAEGILNACMQFDDNSLKPAYKLLIGIPGSSYALKIAKGLGLDPFIISQALAAQNEGYANFEKLITFAEKTEAEAAEAKKQAADLKRRAEEELIKARKERAELNVLAEKINRNARLEIKRLIGNASERASELIEEISEIVKDADESGLLKAKKLKKQIERLEYANDLREVSDFELKPVDISSLAVGAKVYVLSDGGGRVEAIVTAIPEGKRQLVGLTANGMALSANISKLFAAENVENADEKNNNKPAKPFRQESAVQPTAPAPSVEEIKLLGLTVQEAILTIEPVIMSRITRNITLKLVHGKGTGALGRGIQNYLKTLKEVKSIRYGGYGEGDKGVTFAELI